MLYYYQQEAQQLKITTLRKLKMKLLGIKPKPVFLTVKDIREIMIKGEDMPTAISAADKQDYIVKPRTIYTKRGQKRIIRS